MGATFHLSLQDLCHTVTSVSDATPSSSSHGRAPDGSPPGAAHAAPSSAGPSGPLQEAVPRPAQPPAAPLAAVSAPLGSDARDFALAAARVSEPGTGAPGDVWRASVPGGAARKHPVRRVNSALLLAEKAAGGEAWGWGATAWRKAWAKQEGADEDEEEDLAYLPGDASHFKQLSVYAEQLSITPVVAAPPDAATRLAMPLSPARIQRQQQQPYGGMVEQPVAGQAGDAATPAAALGPPLEDETPSQHSTASSGSRQGGSGRSVVGVLYCTASSRAAARLAGRRPQSQGQSPTPGHHHGPSGSAGVINANDPGAIIELGGLAASSSYGSSHGGDGGSEAVPHGALGDVADGSAGLDM